MRARIAAAFDAAEAYDAHAAIQREAAGLLARAIAALPLPAGPSVLEIGCGTGFLATALGDRMADADWLATDIAPAMLARASARLGARRGVRFALIDGEAPALGEERFDLVCASLAFQWFADLPAALVRLAALLRPGGHIAFATLGEGSFTEWRAAHQALGLDAGTPIYPSANALRAMLPGLALEIVPLRETHASALDFLRALKAIGAGVPRNGHRPLGAAALRAVMRRFEAMGGVASYEIAICTWRG